MLLNEVTETQKLENVKPVLGHQMCPNVIFTFFYFSLIFSCPFFLLNIQFICDTTYFSAFKQLIASKIKVFVFVHVCVCAVYIEIQTHACIYLIKICNVYVLII